jgi:hypothetical protein
VDQRFTADEEQVADVVALGDVHDVLRLLERDASRCLGSNCDRAKPQKPQSALQMFVMANCR